MPRAEPEPASRYPPPECSFPKELIGKDIWKERFKSIRAFERHIARSGTIMLKFFLHVSKEEQRHRFLARLEQPAKRWKFSMGDVAERKLWDKYMHAYEDAIRETFRTLRPREGAEHARAFELLQVVGEDGFYLLPPREPVCGEADIESKRRSEFRRREALRHEACESIVAAFGFERVRVALAA